MRLRENGQRIRYSHLDCELNNRRRCGSWDGTTLNWSRERNAFMSNPEYRNLIDTYGKNLKKKPYTKRMDRWDQYESRAVRLLGQEVDGNEESNPLKMLITQVLDLRVLLRQFH